jgi:hypothetical protein
VLSFEAATAHTLFSEVFGEPAAVRSFGGGVYDPMGDVEELGVGVL